MIQRAQALESKQTQIQILLPALATSTMLTEWCDMTEPWGHLQSGNIDDCFKTPVLYLSESSREGTNSGFCTKVVIVGCFHSLQLELDSTTLIWLLWMHQWSCSWHSDSSLTLPPYNPGRRGNSISSIHLHCLIQRVMFLSYSTGFEQPALDPAACTALTLFSFPTLTPSFASLSLDPHASPWMEHQLPSYTKPLPNKLHFCILTTSLAGLLPPVGRLVTLILPLACTLEMLLCCSALTLELRGQMLPDPVCASLFRQVLRCFTSPVGLALTAHPLSSCPSQPGTSPPSRLFFTVGLTHKSKLIKLAPLEEYTHLIPALSFCSRLRK